MAMTKADVVHLLFLPPEICDYQIGPGVGAVDVNQQQKINCPRCLVYLDKLAQAAKMDHGILNPNSCKQGEDPRHVFGPHYNTIMEFGYQYSHTTPVVHGQSSVKPYHYVNHHTYKFADHCVMVYETFPGVNRWETSTGRATGRRHRGLLNVDLRDHLQRKRGRYKTLDNRIHCAHCGKLVSDVRPHGCKEGGL